MIVVGVDVDYPRSLSWKRTTRLAMEPAKKKPSPKKQPAAPAVGRKLRFDAAEVQIPRRPYFLVRKDRPGDR